jgi:spermidine/putrescine transport system ATP-binding protein
MNESLAVIRNVSHRFGAVEVLKDISLEILPGSYTVLLGPSGSGKTTLLSILGGFLTPSEGQVFIGGEDCTLMPPAERPTTTVFQDYALFPHMSVVANVAFGLRMRKVRRAQRNARALDLLGLVGLDQAARKRPHQLSGGQRQRVALARALVVEPKVLLLDEPLGALDLKLRRQMQDELKAIQKRVGTAFVHVTHDQEEAMALADEVVVMNDGRIEDHGPPEEVYRRPRSRFAAAFMGESTIFRGKVVEVEKTDRLLVMTPLGKLTAHGKAEEGEEIELAVRPENLKLQGTREAWLNLGRARVTDVVFQGSFKRVIAVSDSMPPVQMILRISNEEGVKLREHVDIYCRPADLILLKA